MSHSDLCDNKLSEFEGDENRTVEKIVEIMKTIKLCQFEPKQEEVIEKVLKKKEFNMKILLGLDV